MVTWFNGHQGQNTAAQTDAMQYGDGLFETLLVTDQKIHFLEEHLLRLKTGLQRLSIVIEGTVINEDFQQLQNFLAMTSNAQKTWRLKYSVYRDKTGLVNRNMALQPYLRDVNTLQQAGIKARLCQQRLSSSQATAGLKLLNRVDYDAAAKECKDSTFFEGIMSDQHGRWIEGSISNLFAFTKQKELITAPLMDCGVEGIMRQLIIQRLSAVAICHEAYLPPLEEIEELFICNSLIGIVPIVHLQNQHLSIGPVTRQLQQALMTLNG